MAWRGPWAGSRHALRIRNAVCVIIAAQPLRRRNGGVREGAASHHLHDSSGSASVDAPFPGGSHVQGVCFCGSRSLRSNMVVAVVGDVVVAMVVPTGTATPPRFLACRGCFLVVGGDFLPCPDSWFPGGKQSPRRRTNKKIHRAGHLDSRAPPGRARGCLSRLSVSILATIPRLISTTRAHST